MDSVSTSVKANSIQRAQKFSRWLITQKDQRQGKEGKSHAADQAKLMPRSSGGLSTSHFTRPYVACSRDQCDQQPVAFATSRGMAEPLGY